MREKSKQLREMLFNKKENGVDFMSADELAACDEFCEGYKEFLSYGKTERLVVEEGVELLKKAGFVDGSEVKSIKPGDKLYFVNRNKNIAAFIIGSKPLAEGLRILGAHIDSPRLDLKENPIYEDSGFVLGDTLVNIARAGWFSSDRTIAQYNDEIWKLG